MRRFFCDICKEEINESGLSIRHFGPTQLEVCGRCTSVIDKKREELREKHLKDFSNVLRKLMGEVKSDGTKEEGPEQEAGVQPAEEQAGSDD